MRVRELSITSSSAHRARKPATGQATKNSTAHQSSANTIESTIHVIGNTAMPTSIRTVPFVTGTRTRREASRTIR